MFYCYQKIFQKLQIYAFLSILSTFYTLWVQTDMNQHKSKEKNVFFCKKTHFKCTKYAQQESKSFLLFQVGKNLVSKRDKIKNGLQRSQDSLETKRKRCFDGLYDFFLFL